MHFGQVSGHQPPRQVLVGRRAGAGKMEAHLDEQHARREHPELFRTAPVMGHERFRRGMKLGLARTVIEHAPQRTPRIDRIENDVARGVVKGFDKSAGQVENDRALAALARFGNEFA